MVEKVHSGEGLYLSFIIPALNEEKYIGQTLASIRTNCRTIAPYEMIVCDHGSRDRTREIATEAGAVVIQPQTATIAGLRNAGAARSQGKVLIFLDADTSLTADWARHAGATLSALLESPHWLSGSRTVPDRQGGWLAKWWFAAESDKERAAYVGSAHMILHRELFERIGGFDDRLHTGEDYDFCMRALASGAELQLNPDMVVEHRRLPRTLLELVRRERWHGMGDLVSLRKVLDSRVALMALVFMLLHVGLLAGIWFSGWLVALSALLLLGHLLLTARIKFRHRSLRFQLQGAFLFYFYYLGRSLSFFSRKPRTDKLGKSVRPW